MSYQEVLELLRKVDDGYELTEVDRKALLDIEYITWKGIGRIPDSIDLLTGLKHLNVSGSYDQKSRLVSIPESIGNLTSLQTLNLNWTNVCELPESIGNLSDLQILDLRLTQIKVLPESIGRLSGLQRLDLSWTKLRELPEKIGYLPNLKCLVLEGLSLSELPESLLQLNLEYKNTPFFWVEWLTKPGIYLARLELLNQPIGLFSNDRKLIIEYYESTKNKLKLPINECKVVFLGDGGVGKSLIINRFMNDGYISKEFQGESTPGICIMSKKYSIQNEEIELHFWDFGGQAIMHSMHRMFLTNRTLYVVVTSAREHGANKQAWYWIRNIKSFADGAPVLLIVNKKDQNPLVTVNEIGLLREYPELKQVRIVSALNDTKEEFDANIRDVLFEIVSNMDTVHAALDVSWLSLMNDLQEMQENYITSGAFYKMCSQNRIDTDNKKILDLIISWYQDLGVCFYSKAHPVSAQYMVLKPIWLLNALYILVFNGRKYSKNGIIPEKAIYNLICDETSDDFIKKVWTDIKYKPEEIQYIINVLLNFELIFRIDNDHFFIPMLCDENESEIIDSFVSDEAIHICFKYNYLPENVIYRLMVRHGYELNTDVVWKTGALFERPQCEWSSLIRIIDNSLDIYAKSDNQRIHPVNSYLDMIRASIYRINDEIKLTADEYIAYRKDEKEESFKYKKLIGIKNANHQEVYSEVFDKFIEVDEILGAIKSPEKIIADEFDSQIERLLNSLMGALKKLQNNSTYYNASENECNSYIRDLLETCGYKCKDQTLHGISTKGNNEGELDILICDKDRDVDLSIFEALKLKAFGKKDQDYLLIHLKKLIDNYNPEGLSNLFLVSYVSWDKNHFNTLANDYSKYVMRNADAKFRFTRSQVIESYNSNFIRCLKVAYDCDGTIINVYHIIVRVAK